MSVEKSSQAYLLFGITAFRQTLRTYFLRGPSSKRDHSRMRLSTGFTACRQLELVSPKGKLLPKVFPPSPGSVADCVFHSPISGRVAKWDIITISTRVIRPGHYRVMTYLF